MAETCAKLLLDSVRGCQVHSSKKKSEPDRAQFYKSINNHIISLLGLQRGANSRGLSDGNGAHDSPVALMSSISENVAEIVHEYVWLTRCCNNATAIADTFNSMHLAGILVCKCFAVLCSRPAAVTQPSFVSSFFPRYPTIHVCLKSIHELSYSELVFLLTSLQLKWDVLITMDIIASSRVLVCCMARFGQLAAMQWPDKVLDDTQERERAQTSAAHEGVVGASTAAIPSARPNASASLNNSSIRSSSLTYNTPTNPANLWVISRRATRHFVSTFLCMIREMAILHASTAIAVHSMSVAEYGKYTTDEVMAYGFQLAPDISDGIRGCFRKIKSIREAERHACTNSRDVGVVAAETGGSEVPSTDKTWDFLLKKLGPHKLGPRPRKMDAEFSTLLTDVIVSLSDTYNHAANTTVTRSCLNIIQTALKYYYVVPSAERYRDIVLMQQLCPGQRLNYAFDYMHFDTGQLSQVIYLHNLQFKQGVPPTTVHDWKDNSPAGPIAAFLQLITDLELWLQDADDPLGLLGDSLQIRRPLDRNKEAAQLAGTGNGEENSPDSTQKVRARVRCNSLVDIFLVFWPVNSQKVRNGCCCAVQYSVYSGGEQDGCISGGPTTGGDVPRAKDTCFPGVPSGFGIAGDVCAQEQSHGKHGFGRHQCTEARVEFVVGSSIVTRLRRVAAKPI